MKNIGKIILIVIIVIFVVFFALGVINRLSGGGKLLNRRTSTETSIVQNVNSRKEISSVKFIEYIN